MEASALRAPAVLPRSRFSAAAPLLRLHTDEQLVRSFRGGEDEAFRVIYDRYRQRLFAYARQMLHCRQDAEDVLQDVFVRAYSGLRADDRDLALRAWLYRVAHNRCVDELRRPSPAAPELGELVRPRLQDPIAQAEQRESLRRLIEDVRRLPDQQRSALLMRELTGMSYVELAGVLAISIPAVKSLLVRARVGLAQAAEARETACEKIRSELVLAHDCRRRPAALARRHLRDCAPCRDFRTEVRGISRQLAGMVPVLGPAGVLANLLGFGSGGGAAAGSGAAAGGGTLAGGGLLATGAGHAVTLLAAAAVTVGGAAEIQHSLSGPGSHHASVLPRQAPGAGSAMPSARALGIFSPAPSAGSSAGTATTTQSSGAPTASRAAHANSAATRSAADDFALTGSGSQPVDPAALDPAMGPGPIMGTDANATGSSTSGATDTSGATATTSTSPTLPPGGGLSSSTTPGAGAQTGSSAGSGQSGRGSSLLPGVIPGPATAGSASGSAPPNPNGPPASASSAQSKGSSTAPAGS